ncbi:hypothetical protein [Pseudemcibacter aquimaris]|uniref:hypothetical protein n=1 Tax=Pseudemcibacter aquimaris TaxID=2857064 RepID=UPI002011C67B|nr:hypothetical protein [Pseudemcibacter aquimaris]MCC3859921.1 hypothetical protein [Pseudemcibacter aquimaris]WDU57253.1 hypothetical protein KW060_08585 [Pseudemcibacter aquimaris]
MEFFWQYFSDINSGVVGGLLAAPATAAVAYTCRFNRPTLSKLIGNKQTLNTVNWDILGFLIIIGTFIGLFVLLVFGFWWGNNILIGSMINDNEIKLIWMSVVPVIFPILGLSTYTGLRLLRLIGLSKGGMSYKKYAAYKAIQYKIDPIKLQKRLLRPLQLLSLTFLLLGSLIHVRIIDNILYYLPYLSFNYQVFDLSTVNKITLYSKAYAPNGNIIEIPSLVLEFEDGKKFNSDDTSLFFDEDTRAKLTSLAKKYSNIDPEFSTGVNTH